MLCWRVKQQGISGGSQKELERVRRKFRVWPDGQSLEILGPEGGQLYALEGETMGKGIAATW